LKGERTGRVEKCPVKIAGKRHGSRMFDKKIKK
jgi:hypothetical protein